MEQERNADPPFDPLSSDRRAKRQRVGRSLFDAAPACAQPRRMNPPSQQQQHRLTEALLRQHEAAMDGREAAGQQYGAEQDRQSEGGKTLEYEPWPAGE
ncbi:hypothetical protein WJX75_004482 [Coccomyxa subellipsoidea]|uniref:Uncharacterized protein n=1 Tax=Coccomyxa subellipsoidea TaxID=248742 RepID=A0ABR2YHY5_9CHLO